MRIVGPTLSGAAYYPDGMSSSDYCYVEGHIYADPKSADPMERRAAAAGNARSTCARCGEPNYALRSALGAETRRRRERERSRST